MDIVFCGFKDSYKEAQIRGQWFYQYNTLLEFAHF